MGVVLKQIILHHPHFSDKSYILSSEWDHGRATFQAHTGTSRIVSLAEYLCVALNLLRYFLM